MEAKLRFIFANSNENGFFIYSFLICQHFLYLLIGFIKFIPAELD